jgi:hypothetical protein
MSRFMARAAQMRAAITRAFKASINRLYSGEVVRAESIFFFMFNPIFN